MQSRFSILHPPFPRQLSQKEIRISFLFYLNYYRKSAILTVLSKRIYLYYKATLPLPEGEQVNS